MIKTKITEMLNIKHPIVQGGMHYVGFAEMAAAVSNALNMILSIINVIKALILLQMNLKRFTPSVNLLLSHIKIRL